jgi:molybdopterin-binding protein
LPATLGFFKRQTTGTTEIKTMKISARNKLAGKVIAIEKGAVNSIVKIQLTGTPTITAVVTNDAVEDLELSIDGKAVAVVKASSVLVGICNDKSASECKDGQCGCQGE